MTFIHFFYSFANFVTFLFREIKSYSRALHFHRDRIPDDRQNALFRRLAELCPDEDVLADDFLPNHIDIETMSVHSQHFYSIL